MSPSAFARVGEDAWLRLGQGLGASHECIAWHDRLVTAYRAPSRFYHNDEHLAECLSVFDQLRDFAVHPAIVECALWFHDAEYDPRASDNEEQSAVRAAEYLCDAGAREKVRAAVEQLILATKTHVAGENLDACVVLDADLAVLGQRPERFWRYEAAIAAEYAWVPETVYREKRREVLERFLSRPKIYHTSYALKHYEPSARENLRAAIEKLRFP